MTSPWRNTPGPRRKWDGVKKCPFCGFPMKDGQTFVKSDGLWVHAYCEQERNE